MNTYVMWNLVVGNGTVSIIETLYCKCILNRAKCDNTIKYNIALYTKVDVRNRMLQSNETLYK